MGLKAVANLGGGGGGGGISGSGTPGKLAKFTGTGTSIGDSLLSESGTTITSAATAEAFGSAQTWTVGAPNSQALVVKSNAGPESTLVLDTISRAVGVGGSPGTLLHVQDNAGFPFAGSTYEGVRLQRATQALFSSSDYTRSFRAGITASTAVVGTSTAHDLLLQRNNVTAATLQSGAIASVTLTAGGTLYTNGTYSQQALTGGTGTGATADIVVAGGVVTSCVVRSPGSGYTAADALSCATIGAGAGFVLTVATIAQIVAGSGNVTALGRIGAGTATPRAALDAVGGMVADGAVVLPYYNSAVSNPLVGVHSFQIGVAGSSAIAPTGNTQYTALTINPLLDTTASTTQGIRSVFAGLIMATSPAGYTGTTTGFQVSAYRREPGDLATAANITGFTATLGAGPGLGSVSTNLVKTLNSFIISGNVGHTITSATHLDLSWTATGSITTATGLNCNAISGTGTITTFYGVRIQASTTPTITNRWGISQEDTLASNQFSAVTNTFSGIVRATGSTAAAPAFSTPADTDTGMYFPSANTVRIGTGGSPGLEIDSTQNLKFNSGFGSTTTAYGCRAWANWNNVGVIAIRASGGVSSLTDDGVGITGVNFSFTMPDLNYCLSGMRQPIGGNTTAYYDSFTNVVGPTFIRSTTACHVIGYDMGLASDSPNVNLAIFR